MCPRTEKLRLFLLGLGVGLLLSFLVGTWLWKLLLAAGLIALALLMDCSPNPLRRHTKVL